MKPRRLTVLYDRDCSLCCSARAWLQRQDAFVELEFVAAGSAEAQRRFPGLVVSQTLKDLNVISDTGDVYYGAKAWVLCLWALVDYRELSTRIASRELLPWAKRFVAWVARHRYGIGTVSRSFDRVFHSWSA